MEDANDDFKDDFEDQREENAIEEEKDNEYDLRNFGYTVNIINLDEKDKYNEEEQNLLKVKKKRVKKLRNLPIPLFKNKRKKEEPGVLQKIFDIISKKDEINENVIYAAAEKAQYKIDKQNMQFLLELGRAKVSLKKYGLPGDICKKPFHIFVISPFFKQTSVITDDRLIWRVYFSEAFKKEMVQFKNICLNSSLSTVSFITDRVFKCNSVFSGYVQDFKKNVSIITEEPVADDQAQVIENAIKNKIEGSTYFQTKLMNGNTVNYFQYNSLIMVGPGNSNLQTLIADAKNTKCINTKNKLATGLKQIKVNEGMASYINIHDIKTTDFSPSCLFIRPIVPDITLFISGELNNNSVYDICSDSVAKNLDLLLLPFPPDAIFWDNLNSFIQLIGLLNLIGNPTKEISGKISSLIEVYQKNKNILNAWKRVYKQFENLVLSFYDKVTYKLTIDGIKNLKGKAAEFLSNYTFLKKDESYGDVGRVIANLPNVRMIKNFAMLNIAQDLVSGIAKLIIILESGKSNFKEGVGIDDMFRSLGIFCTEVMFNGTYPMIPKVRSKAAFLGGPGKQMANQTLKTNISYLIDSFKSNLKEKEMNEDKKLFIGYQDMDEIISRVVDNSFNKLNEPLIKKFANELKKQIKLDDTLYNSIREDILEMLKNGEEKEDILAYGDFLDNTLFNSFIKLFKDVGYVVGNSYKKVDFPKIIQNINIKPRAVKKMRKKKPIQKDKKVSIDTLVVDKVVTLDANALNESLEQPTQQIENIKQALDQVAAPLVAK